MGRPIKNIKAKEPVHIRERKLKDGSISLYLDIYQNGIRRYEGLNLYIVPEQTPLDKQMNENARAAAEKIKAERIILVQNNGLKQWAKVKKSDLPFIIWLEQDYESETGLSATSIRHRKEMRKMLTDFLKEKGKEAVKVKNFDEDLCRGFIEYLRNSTNRRLKNDSRPISVNTMARRQDTLRCALNKALRSGLIDYNPILRLEKEDKVSREDGTREFLTIEEIRLLIKTPCGNEQVKKAFLFACFTGLRLSDVQSLTWNKVNVTPDGLTKFVRVVMQKTKKPINVPLTSDALANMYEKADRDEPIFNLPFPSAIGKHLKKWVKDAGILKHITFHCSRHTFATMMLTLGVDIYTTSSLLGHSNVSTTQIYAKIVDEKKVSAVHAMDNLFS